MKRIIIIVTLALGLFGLATASLPLLLSSEAVRERITARVSGITGQSVSFRGDPSVSFSPFMGIEISELEINGRDDQPLLTIEQVRGKLKLLSALGGNIELHELQFLRPRLQLKTDNSGVSNWHLENGSLKRAFDSTAAALQEDEPETPMSAILGAYEIQDGVIEYVDEIDGTAETITNINGVLDWPNTNSAVSIQGSAVLRNENGIVDLTAQTPMRIIAGGESEVVVNFTSEPLDFLFDGKANTISNLFAKGSLKASTPSIVRLSDFLNFDFGESNAVIGKWEAEGVFEGTSNMALLSEAKIAIGENRAAGIVGLSRSETGNAKLDGTLAFNEIDLSGYLQSNVEAVNESIESTDQNTIAIDLRLSANAMNAGNLRFENVAASITSGDDGWKFDIGNATAFGGSIVASLGSIVESENRQLILKLSSKDTDIGAVGSAAGEENPTFSGIGNINADLRTPLPIEDLYAMPVNGELSIEAASGSIKGIDFNKLFGIAEEADGQIPQLPSSEDQTDFENLYINTFLNSGRASISKAMLETAEKRIQIHGDADLSKGSMALSAQEVSDDGPISDRLIIGGTFSNPLISLKPTPAGARNKDREANSEAATE